MTEAAILALIALVGVIVFCITAVLLVGNVLKAAPASFNFWTSYGHFEVKFDTKVDE